MNKAEIPNYAKNAKRVNKDDMIERLVKGKHVLDVGCIGQDRGYKSETWLHNKVKRFAAKTDGVDILSEEIKELRQQGYSIFSVEELKATSNKYEIVLMADVIEHVNDPVGFLAYYAEYLNTGGQIFISTPNSNRANNFINILFNNNYSVNPEHTFWFCPKTLAEVVNRARLNIDEFYWSNPYYSLKDVKGFYQKFKFIVGRWLMSMRTNFSSNMIFILSKN